MYALNWYTFSSTERWTHFLDFKKKKRSFLECISKKHYTFFPCLACDPTGHSEMLALSAACPGRAEQWDSSADDNRHQDIKTHCLESGVTNLLNKYTLVSIG